MISNSVRWFAIMRRTLTMRHGCAVQLIAKLADAGIHTRDELADLATDELTDITAQTSEEATALIMLARAHWFTGDEAQSTT